MSSERFTVTARGVVNASGPWVGQVRSLAGGAGAKHRVRLVKGSHIVVRKLFDHANPYIFQTGDGRVLFAIPYEEDYTLLGTTDVEFEAAPGRVEITPQEVDYICAAANDYFETPVAPDDVVWTYSGIRPLFDDHAENASEVTRDYVLHLDPAPAPMLSVYGGKLTTYRRLAERAVDMLAGPLRANGSRWTADAPLPVETSPTQTSAPSPRNAPRAIHGCRSGCSVTCIRHYGTDIHALLAGRSSVRVTWASTSGPGSTRRRSRIWSSTSGPGPPRTSCGGAPGRVSASPQAASSGCARTFRRGAESGNGRGRTTEVGPPSHPRLRQIVRPSPMGSMTMVTRSSPLIFLFRASTTAPDSCQRSGSAIRPM